MSNSTENENEKVFKNFPFTPRELQMMIIDEMHPADRCRFRRCSKLCDKQAKSSKQFIYRLLIAGNENFIEIEVLYNDYGTGKYPECGFRLSLKKEYEKNVMRYLNFKREELWRMELCQSTDLLQLAVQMFKLLLKDHQNSVKNLDISGKPVWKKLESLGFGVESLRNLEEICGKDILIKPLFPMLRRPLKDLTVFWMDDNENLQNCKEIYQVQERLNISFLKLNNEQFLRLTASYIIIDIGDISAQDISNFIKSWQNGLIRNNLTFCRWRLERFNFDSNQLFGCFEGVTEFMIGSRLHKKVWIKNNKDPSKRAKLYFSDSSCLMFEVYDD